MAAAGNFNRFGEGADLQPQILLRPLAHFQAKVGDRRLLEPLRLCYDGVRTHGEARERIESVVVRQSGAGDACARLFDGNPYEQIAAPWGSVTNPCIDPAS